MNRRQRRRLGAFKIRFEAATSDAQLLTAKLEARKQLTEGEYDHVKSFVACGGFNRAARRKMARSFYQMKSSTP